MGAGIFAVLVGLVVWGKGAGSDLKMLAGAKDRLSGEMESGMRCRALELSYAGTFLNSRIARWANLQRGRVTNKGVGISQVKMRICQSRAPENTRYRSLFATRWFTSCPP